MSFTVAVLVIVVALVLFGVAAAVTGPFRGLEDAVPDGADTRLPEGALQPQDLGRVRFPMVFRGYRMADVDDTLDRLAAELAARDEVIAELRGEPVEPHGQGIRDEPGPVGAPAQASLEDGQVRQA